MDRMKVREMIADYFEKFKDFPPTRKYFNESSEIYQRMLRIALDTNTPITDEKLEAIVEKYKIIPKGTYY